MYDQLLIFHNLKKYTYRVKYLELVLFKFFKVLLMLQMHTYQIFPTK